MIQLLFGLVLVLAGNSIGFAADAPIAGCAGFSGYFSNIGRDDPQNNRGSHAPPRFTWDVLPNEPPRSKIQRIFIDATQVDAIEFKYFETNNSLVGTHVYPSSCVDGWQTFVFSITGSSEGYSGTEQITVRLMPDANDLLVHKVREVVGKFFFIFPHKSHAAFEYRFPFQK